MRGSMRNAINFIIGSTLLTLTSCGGNQCVYTPWSDPVNMGPEVNSPYNDSHSWITKNGLSLYITTTRFSMNVNDEDIAVSQRRSLSDPWGTPVRLGPNVNTVGFNDAV